MKYPPVRYILFDLQTHKYIADYATLDKALHNGRKSGCCKVVEQKSTREKITFTTKSTII